MLLSVSFAFAQAPTRVRGTITAVEGDVLTLDHKLQVRLGEKTELVYAQPIALAEIGPGDFLGVSSIRRPDGTLSAYEVRRFPKPVNPRHGPLEGRSDHTMTNATVEAIVRSASARELTLAYGSGVQKIVVPESASVSTLVPGKRSQLAPGAPVSLTMGEDRVALRIQVSPPK